MNKPNLFIGSSIEGLNVAYAIQENLKFVSETTVWDQGVFNLSESSLESLLSVLDSCDFGVFVFTPDDYIRIRGKKDLIVRDNVLFELGLFIGRLGKQRCFIVVPDNKTFHLPTDLIGVTPGKYEASREDKNLQAGAGSVSHKIRERIIQSGSLKSMNEEPDSQTQSTNDDSNKGQNQDWNDELFIKKNYDEAIKLLKKKIRQEKDEDSKLTLKTFICYAIFQKDAQKGKIEYEKLILENKTNNITYLSYANLLFWNNSFIKAIEVLDTGLANCQRKISLTKLKVDCLWETNQKEAAFSFLLETSQVLKDPLLITKLASLNLLSDKKKDALKILYNGFLDYPYDKEILSHFASISYDLGHKDLSILLYKKLIEEFPNSSEFWCLLGNAYLDLNLYSFALTAYEKANNLAGDKEAWILSNIGNLFYNKELYDKSEYYLTLAQDLNKNSEYIHSRLSSVYQHKKDENKKLEEFLKSAKEKLNGSILD